MFILYLSPFLPCLLSFGNSLVVVIKRALKYTSGKGSSKPFSACHAKFTYFLNTSYWSSRSRAVWCHHLHVHFNNIHMTYSILAQHIVPQSCVCTKKSDRPFRLSVICTNNAIIIYDAIVSTKIMWWHSQVHWHATCHQTLQDCRPEGQAPSARSTLRHWWVDQRWKSHWPWCEKQGASDEGRYSWVVEVEIIYPRAWPALRDVRSDDERLGTFVCGVFTCDHHEGGV